MSAKAARSSMGLFKLWTTDSGAFPVAIICSFAAVAPARRPAATCCTTRTCASTRASATAPVHYQSEDGADWRARRFHFANIHRNDINQSRQFDPAFAKDENKSVAR
ncbi:hypothetical protein PF002_g30673 [Phytophthora fragariae]|uniref:Uncharacterized protein n=1 Tax=Phytophthora fragariae TaxID=53985 RepID=A0A6A3VIU4_9STRA|nr:hypothetical protein PF002_g30673 [Phytophthora fragariae]